MREVEISPRAYVKMCLHAARYPHVAVNGLLLAQKRQLTAGPPKCLYITDCVPLFHSNLSLTVMLEVALNQLDNRKFGISPQLPPLTVLEQRDRQWVPKDKNLHLDDIRQDWTNQQLNTEIAQLVSVANGSV
ncbi:hypothetical protein E2320_003624 [Naja naja]|nr:hypothetical protein E2320_003624 [Naja naja]